MDYGDSPTRSVMGGGAMSYTSLPNGNWSVRYLELRRAGVFRGGAGDRRVRREHDHGQDWRGIEGLTGIDRNLAAALRRMCCVRSSFSPFAVPDSESRYRTDGN